MAFNENSRVKLPALVHLCKLDISVMLTPVSVMLTPLTENGSMNR
jgi:hypothetical protein